MRTLRFHFDPLVAAVHDAGGFITGFAGDAFTAVFPVLSTMAPGPGDARRFAAVARGSAEGRGVDSGSADGFVCAPTVAAVVAHAGAATGVASAQRR